MKRFVLILCLCCFGCTPAPETDEFFPEPGNPTIECDDDSECCPKVAARYHLRKRTQKFFRRVC